MKINIAIHITHLLCRGAVLWDGCWIKAHEVLDLSLINGNQHS